MPSLLPLFEARRESGVAGPHFLDLGTTWRSAVSLTLRTHYLRVRVHGTHQIECQVGLTWKMWRRKNLLLLPEIEGQYSVFQPITLTLYQFRYPSYFGVLGLELSHYISYWPNFWQLAEDISLRLPLQMSLL